MKPTLLNNATMCIFFELNISRLLGSDRTGHHRKLCRLCSKFKMADDDVLSPSQTEKLIQFQEIVHLEDIDSCRRILQDHNWDIQSAVQDTLNIQEPAGSPMVYSPNSRSPIPVSSPPANQSNLFHAIRPWQPVGLLGWGYFLVSFPFAFIYNTFTNILRFTLNLLRADPRHSITDPLQDVLKFISSYEVKYGSIHPVFYQGTYSQVLTDSKKELKFLLVYLHGEDHQETPRFCRNTLGNECVVQFINTNMLFWACSVNSPEGYRVSQALRENSYPFLAVIVLRENRMTVVARLEGYISPTNLNERLQRIMDENESSLVVARMERQELSLNQTLRQQQDEAYLESLKADQEKERKKQEDRDRQEKEEQTKRDQVQAVLRQKEDLKRQKIELADQIPAEPSIDDPYTIRVLIKLPNGRRLERSFRRDHSLKHLFYFVFCHEESPESFQIVTNYPLRVLPCQPTSECPEPPTFAEANLGKSEMLFVQDLDA